MPHYYDDELKDYLARLKPPRWTPKFVSLPCPDCLHVAIGQGEKDAQELLDIHREAACQGGGERDDDGDPPADPPAGALHALRVTAP